MGRIIYTLIALSLVTTGCQKARMQAVAPKPAPSASATPAPQPVEPSCWDLGTCPQPPPPQTCEQQGNCPIVTQPPVQPPVITERQPVNPVVTPTDREAVVNPVGQEPVAPKFTPPPVTCAGGCGEQPAPKPVLVCGEGGPCPEIEPVAGSCKIRPVTSEKTVTIKPKLDILFVLDTSPSFRIGPKGGNDDGEIYKLASEMSSFIRSLPDNTDYRIGVILGNGPESPTFGKLFAGRNDPAVLDSQKMSEQEIWRALKEKMLSVPDDRAPGSRVLSDPQGEMLMLNLYTVLANAESKAAVIRAGLFRKDANLAIIAVSDENDPCYSYPYDVSKYNAVNEELFAAGKVPVLKPYGSKLEMDRKEVLTQRFCKTIEGGKLSHTDVLGQLRLLETERKTNIIMNGIVYKSNQGLRARVSDQDENEMGHGTLDLIYGIRSGKAIDMADVRSGNGEVSFASALSQLGATTSVQMLYKTVWDCFGTVHPNAIDDSSVEVQIIEASPEEVANWSESKTLDDRGNPIAKYSAQCRGGRACQAGDGGVIIERKSHREGAYLRVTPFDAFGFEKLMKDRRIRGAKYKITFMTKRGVDPRTGQPGTAAN